MSYTGHEDYATMKPYIALTDKTRKKMMDTNFWYGGKDYLKGGMALSWSPFLCPQNDPKNGTLLHFGATLVQLFSTEKALTAW